MNIANLAKDHAQQMKSKDDEVKSEKGLQLTLGELITKLEKADSKFESSRDEEMHDKHVEFDFCSRYTKKLSSYRGYYRDLAIEPTDDNEERKTVNEFLEMLKKALGKEFTGYKGGQFEMDENTVIWAADWGYSTGTAISGVRETGTRIILQTNRISQTELEGDKIE